MYRLILAAILPLMTIACDDAETNTAADAPAAAQADDDAASRIQGTWTLKITDETRSLARIGALVMDPERFPTAADVDASDLSDAETSSNSPIYRSRHLQQSAAELGFDWPDIGPVFDKLEEELGELREAWASGDKQAISDELGDVLFVCVNIARHARIDAEMSLRKTNRKFERRFAYVREQMQAANIPMQQGQLEQMERFWQEAKKLD